MSDSRTFRVQRATSDFRWPNDARIGIVFNLAYEAWSPGKAPGIGPMGNVLQPGFFDTNAHSWASYGAVRGIQRLTRIAAANNVKTSIMVNGVLAETHPTVLKELHAAGHEIVAHSYGMDVIPVYFDEAGERANIRRTGDLIAAVTGERPKGWISPRGTGSLISPKLLAEEGYVWFGDCNDDDLPSIITQKDAPEQRIVGIPLTMDVNDLPHSIRYGNAPATLIDQFRAILDNASQADAAPFMLDVTAHTHVFGRPAGAWVYDAMIKLARKRDDVWIGTRMEIAEYALAQGRWFKDEVF